jgi:hypothetical protein
MPHKQKAAELIDQEEVKEVDLPVKTGHSRNHC